MRLHGRSLRLYLEPEQPQESGPLSHKPDKFQAFTAQKALFNKAAGAAPFKAAAAKPTVHEGRVTIFMDLESQPSPTYVVQEKLMKFWIIWTPATTARNPQAQHPSEAVAVAEADRLAKLHPGQTFFVMEVVGKAEVQQSTYSRI